MGWAVIDMVEVVSRVVPDLTISIPAGFRNSHPAGSGSRFGKNLFWAHNNTPDETNVVNNAVSCYKEAKFGELQ